MASIVHLDMYGQKVALPVTRGLTLDTLKSLIRSSAWGQYIPECFSLKYQDDEGDLVSLIDEVDVQEMVRVIHSCPSTISLFVHASLPLVKHTSPSQGKEVAPGARFRHQWILCNESGSAWPEGVRMIHRSGHLLGSFPSFRVPALAPHSSHSIEVNFTAPLECGSYTSEWAVMLPSGSSLFDSCSLSLSVSSSVSASSVFPGLPRGIVYSVFPGISPSALSLSASRSTDASVSLPSCPSVPVSSETTTLSCGACFTRSVSISNQTDEEIADARLVHVSGHRFNSFASSLVAPIPPRSSISIDLHLRAPTEAGEFSGEWQVQRAGAVLSSVRVEARVSSALHSVFPGLRVPRDSVLDSFVCL